MEISFTHPVYLSFLVLIPIIIFIHFLSLRYKGGQAIRFANFEAIAKIRGIDLFSKNIVILVLTIAISVVLILALSGLTVQRTMSASSFSYVIALDSSKSMEADDLFPNRMEIAKQTATEFVENTPAGTFIGVVSFSGNTLIEQELTQDKALVKRAINDVAIKFISGTDLFEAIITSTNLLKPEDAKSIVLLSDGQINIGDLSDAIEYANKHGIMVHSIALGTLEGGMTTYGLSRVDEESLKSVAYNTNGKFFRARTVDEISESLSQILDYKIKNVSFNLTHRLMLIALILFIMEFILINTRYRVFP